VRAGQERKQGKYPGDGTKSALARAGAPSFGGAPRKSASTARLESAWQEAMVRHSAQRPLPYAMKGVYKVQDFLEHPMFGRGEVITVLPGKMEVLFRDGVKTLRCGSM
jgi:hypothetical protein